MENLVLYFNFPEAIFEYTLPAENNRTMTLDVSSFIQVDKCQINLEVWDGIWHIVENNSTTLYQQSKDGSGKQRLTDEILQVGSVINGTTQGKTHFTILAMAADENLSHFTKYDIFTRPEITIGKNENCTLRLTGSYVSGNHMLLRKEGEIWYLTDLSRNGVYINHYRIKANSSIRLNAFDYIYTAGFRMVFLGKYLAINCSENVQSTLPKFSCEKMDLAADASLEAKPFSRSPRLMEPLDTESISIEGPPSRNTQRKQPLLFTIGPALTMPIPILTTMMLRMNLGGSTGGNTYWVMGVSVVMSAVIGLGWSMARRKYDERQAKLTENERISAYLSYIEKNRILLEEKQTQCRNLLLSQYPSSEQMIGWMKPGQNRSGFWNRNVNHVDFGTIRLGVGKMKLPNSISVPKERFSVTNDDLAEKPRILEDAYAIVAGVPARLNLCKHKIVGVIGGSSQISSIARNMVVQLSALHSYADLKIAFLYNQGEDSDYRWIRWLPHVFSSDRQIRMIANDTLSHQNVLYSLCEILQQRASTENSEGTKQLPQYVVFCTVDNLLSSHTIWKYVTDSVDYNVTFVLLYGRMDLLPNTCKCIIQADESYDGSYQLDQSRDETNEINWEMPSREAVEQYARSMSGMFLQELAVGEIPDSISFLEMYGISDISRWDILRRWKENRAYESLSAMIGIGTGGHPIYLDIHEKKHGPHGLVAGTTGSGKSETLQTYILSLILNYHPDEVAFILIDYKGGGMANLFNGIPHVAGMITNIDDSEGAADTNQTHRALVSLQSEIKRRQRIFNEYSVNHIDSYSRIYKDGDASEPMPHLIIISDEFAELKKEQPDFIKELVSTARVGRSLGIHLILATQKPSGVVDDEIWSNSRFKLCLRVQDRQDSMEMLKRPEAALLTKTGRGYLQIGNNESFEMFQSGWSGAGYTPDENVELSRNTTISMIGLDGTKQVVRSKKKASKATQTQLDACVNYICELAKLHNISSVRPLWLPMLPAMIPAEQLRIPENKELIALVGQADLPEQQTQPLFTVRFPACGNILVSGVSGSGKSKLVQTILYSLAIQYSPELVNFYIFDFSNHTFDSFRETPHCGGIAYAENDEKIDRLFRLLTDMMDQRDKELVNMGAASADDYRKQGFGIMPLTLVVIDNYASFVEQYSKYEDTFQKLSRRGLSRGIQFIVTVNALNDMRSKLRQNFTYGIPLRLNERSDYSEILGSTPSFMPKNRPGSGLIKLGSTIAEYQAAMVQDPKGVPARVKHAASKYTAPQIQYIDKEQSYQEFYQQMREETQDMDLLPYGWEIEPIQPAMLDLRQTYCWFISDTVGRSSTRVINNLLYALQEEKRQVHYVCLDDMEAEICSEQVRVYRNGEQIFELMKLLKDEFTQRTAAKKAVLAENPDADAAAYLMENFERIFILFDDFNQFTELAYGDTVEKMYNLMEKIIEKGKGYGIYFFAAFNKSFYSGNYLRVMGKRFTDYKTGIHLGGKLDAQKIIETGLSITEQIKTRNPGDGFAQKGQKVFEIYVPM